MMQMTLWPEKKVIYVNPESIQQLGHPKYVQLLINDQYKMILLRGCTSGRKQGIAIPSIPMIQFEVSGNTLLSRIREMMKWTDEQPKVIPGLYIPSKEIIAFDLQKAEAAEITEEY